MLLAIFLVYLPIILAIFFIAWSLCLRPSPMVVLTIVSFCLLLISVKHGGGFCLLVILFDSTVLRYLRVAAERIQHSEKVK